MPSSLDFFGSRENEEDNNSEKVESIPSEEDNEIEQVEEAKDEDVRWLRRRLRIKVEGDDIPDPWTSWSIPLRHHKNILAGIEESRWIEPTAIQMQCGPIVINKIDCVASAPTGSGKTGAFLIPIAAALEDNDEENALILVPTRELATQLYFETDRILSRSKSRGRICISTPRRALDKKRYTFIILDEVDKLLDVTSDSISFVDQAVASARCKCLFSASITTSVRELATTALNDSMISVTVLSPHETEALSVVQKFIFVGRGNDQNKIATLRELILSGKLKPPCLLFVNGSTRAQSLKYKLKSMSDISSSLSRRVEALFVGTKKKKSTQHKNYERDEIIRNFRAGRIWFLVATDLASRGLDFRALNSVLNYDVPFSATDYLHRVGRVGRAGRSGTAITLFSQADEQKCDLRAIANLALRSGAKVGIHVPEWLLRLPKKKKSRHNEMSQVESKKRKNAQVENNQDEDTNYDVNKPQQQDKPPIKKVRSLVSTASSNTKKATLLQKLHLKKMKRKKR